MTAVQTGHVWENIIPSVNLIQTYTVYVCVQYTPCLICELLNMFIFNTNLHMCQDCSPHTRNRLVTKYMTNIDHYYARLKENSHHYNCVLHYSLHDCFGKLTLQGTSIKYHV